MENENPQTGPLPENGLPILIPNSETPDIPIGVPSPPKGVWPFWPTIGFGAIVFTVYFFAQTIVAVIFAVIFALQQYSHNPNLDPFQLIQSLATNGLLLSLATIISALAGGGAIILFIKLRKGISISEYLGLKTLSKKILLVIFITGVFLVAASSNLDRYFPQSQNSNFTVDAYSTSVWPFLLGIAVVVFAPIFEEGFFRGFLFVGLKQSRLGNTGTIILTSAAWAILHIQYDVYGIISIFVLGIILGIVRLKTNSLWSSMILHALWNLTAIIGIVLYVKGIGN